MLRNTKKGRVAAWLAAVLLLCVCAVAEDAPLFSAESLRQYAADTGVFFRMDGDYPWVNWRYSTASPGQTTYRRGGSPDGVVTFTLLTAGDGEDGYPYLGLQWADGESWRAQTVALRTGDRVYWAEVGTSQSFFHCTRQKEGSYAYTLLLPLGKCGPELLNDLNAQGFQFQVRVYDRSGARLAAEWNGADASAYDRYYRGLTAAGYLDGAGRVQRSILDGLETIDGVSYFPKVTVYEADEALWPTDVEQTPSTASARAVQPDDLRKPEMRAELTGRCDWNRNGDMARFSLGVRNEAKDTAVTRLVFLCFVQESDQVTLLSCVPPVEAMEDVTVKPGKKTTVSLRLDGMEQAAAVMIGLKSVAYADGSVETIAPRDMTFLRCVFR